MDNEELKRQTTAIAAGLDAALEELLQKFDANVVLATTLGRATGLAHQLREAGVFKREDAVMYFGAALANAAAEIRDDTEEVSEG